MILYANPTDNTAKFFVKVVFSHVDNCLQTSNDGTPPKSLDGFTFDLQRFDADVWDGNVATSFSSESGNTITITGAAELAWLAQNIDSYNNFSGTTIKLAVDIDLGQQK